MSGIVSNLVTMLSKKTLVCALPCTAIFGPSVGASLGKEAGGADDENLKLIRRKNKSLNKP